MGKDSAITRALAKLGNPADIRTYAEYKDKVGNKYVNVINTFMRNKMSEADRKALSKASDAQRIQWIRQYLMDPKQALNQGYNKVVNAAYQKEETGWRWLHKEQLEDVLKSKSMAETLVAAKAFEERPSEYEVLAAKGIKQYHYNESVLKKKKHITVT